MNREEIIKEIIYRFKLDSKSLRKLKDYEYEMIYDAFKPISKRHIDNTIDDYCNNKFKIKPIKARRL